MMRWKTVKKPKLPLPLDPTVKTNDLSGHHKPQKELRFSETSQQHRFYSLKPSNKAKSHKSCSTKKQDAKHSLKDDGYLQQFAASTPDKVRARKAGRISDDAKAIQTTNQLLKIAKDMGASPADAIDHYPYGFSKMSTKMAQTKAQQLAKEQRESHKLDDILSQVKGELAARKSIKRSFSYFSR